MSTIYNYLCMAPSTTYMYSYLFIYFVDEGPTCRAEAGLVIVMAWPRVDASANAQPAHMAIAGLCHCRG